MKFKKEFAILFFLITVLVFYITSERGDRTHYTLPEVRKIEKTDISKIEIRKNGTDVALIREGDAWRVGPQKYPAGGALVDKMMNALTGLKLTAMVSESENYQIYELDAEHGITVEAFKGDEPLLRIVIGKPASSYRHTFVMLGGDKRVYHAEGNLRNEFDKTVADLRDKLVMNISDEITEVTLKKGGDTVTIVREAVPEPQDAGQTDKNAAAPRPVRWVLSNGKPVKQSEVEAIVNTVSNLECDAFINDKGKDDFTSPVYTVLLKGSSVYSLSLFKKKDNQYPAVSSRNDYPFLLSEWKAGRIMKDPSSLAEAAQ